MANSNNPADLTGVEDPQSNASQTNKIRNECRPPSQNHAFHMAAFHPISDGPCPQAQTAVCGLDLSVVMSLGVPTLPV